MSDTVNDAIKMVEQAYEKFKTSMAALRSKRLELLNRFVGKMDADAIQKLRDSMK